MPRMIWAIRGATTVEQDTVDQVTERVQALVAAMLSENGLTGDDIVSVLFTATSDVTSTFPATAARALGLDGVALICAREIEVPGALPLCIRVLAHAYTERAREELVHVYLEGARQLREDLVPRDTMDQMERVLPGDS